ncbi:MAG: MFS transporter [Candidatus Wildermuthbacteria bacterium]|nr:MFS transporter [Candidatus Wildermuthbacteria bacterium]
MTKSLNGVIKILVASDFLLQSGWGLIGPIFAIFLTKQIQGGSLEMVGFVAAVYWITKSIIQPFIAHQLDKNHGEKDDFIFLVVGMYVANLIPLGYIFSTEMWHIFALEFVRGLAMACVVPTWAGIFTRHIDRGREAFSWSLESTGIGLAAGIAGALGGIIASVLGFNMVFVLVAIFGTLSSSALLLIRNQIFIKNKFAPRLPPAEKPF